MRAQSLVLAVVLGLGGCRAPGDGYAIDLSVTFDSAVDLARVTQTKRLHLIVSGAEEFTTDVDVTGKFESRTAGLRYKPGAQAGQLTFVLDAYDGADELFAEGRLGDVELKAGETQRFTITLLKVEPDPDASTSGDLGTSDLATCGNGTLDDGEACDPGAGSATPCPASVTDCDDHNPCTDDSFAGAGCAARCTHTPVADNTGCAAAGASSSDGGVGPGVCLGGACCLGCIKDGQCLAGASDPKACGAGGNSCFDCTQNAATATCSGGQCSGCDATSCTTDGRTCGTSSCGYNCGGCADACSNGALTHYACVNKTCQQNGGGNCGLYASCASSSACKTTCAADGECVSTAWCDTTSHTCKPKAALGGSCSSEGQDHECFAPNVCTWSADGVTGICAPARCTGCTAPAATNNYACTGGIAYGKDPRNFCPYVNVCQDGICNGYSDTYAACAGPGQGPDGNPKPCGTTTCADTAAGGFGVMTGAICNGSTCVMNTTAACRRVIDGAPYDLCARCNGSVCSLENDFICN